MYVKLKTQNQSIPQVCKTPNLGYKLRCFYSFEGVFNLDMYLEG